MTNPTPDNQEQAREIVEQWREASDWPGLVWSAQNLSDEPRWLAAWQNLEHRIASALSSRDAEVREVLEGIARYTDPLCWCPPDSEHLPHNEDCVAARALYAKL